MPCDVTTLPIEAADADTRPSEPALLWIGGVTSVAIIVIAATAQVATYRVSPLFLIPLFWAPYLLRRKLFLHPLHYALLAAAVLLHDLGAYGFYQRSPLPFSWDILVHFYFAIPLTLILHQAIAGNFPQLRFWQSAVTSLLFMLGLGALHEIMEYGSYLLLGEEHGMLKPKTSYFLDTQRDLTNNLLGALLTLILLAATRAAMRRGCVGGRDAT